MADMRATFEIKSWHDKIVRQHFERGLRGAFNELGDAILEQAKQNVAPGVGPGPHPHRTEHEDTGALQASLKKQVGDGPKGPEMAIGFGEEYGLYLELGWTTQAGNFYQYPFLQPAIDEQGRRMNLYLAKLKV